MTLFADLFWSLCFLVQGALDAALGRNRKRYGASVEIKAPRDLVWAACAAEAIAFEGPPRIEIATSLRPGTTDVYEGTVSVGDSVIPMAYRQIESRPQEALLIEVLREGSAPSIAPGHDYFVACKLEDVSGGTRLTTVHELTHDNFLGRVLIPLGARHNGRRLKKYCEDLAGTSTGASSSVGAAVLTGALTYASFIYLFDWMFAAILLVLLLIHEAGHALAMRWVGLPVQGIYFIPFLGGVAVSAAPHKTEAERGFVALMGPGFSLLTTGGFMAAAFITEEPLFEALALASAVLNGFNLAPVLPLDGGQVVDAALSRSDPEFVAIINMLALIIGLGVSVYLEWYVLTGLLLLTAPMLLRSGKQKRRAEPISSAGRNWLLAGYLATLAFYIAVTAHYWA